MSTKQFIEGLEFLSRFAPRGLEDSILHAEREEIWIYAKTDLSETDVEFLNERGFTVNEEFDCWRYYASL